METYLVGGAVRDELLGLDVTEKDWVVVGASEKDLLDENFKKVGKDFPVFIHPQTKEEYALARLERKSGKGHKGFDFNLDPSVTLEEELMRSDYTINPIAKDIKGPRAPSPPAPSVRGRRQNRPASLSNPLHIARRSWSPPRPSRFPGDR